MLIENEHRQRKIPVGKNQLLLEFDWLGRSTRHETTYDFVTGLQARIARHLGRYGPARASFAGLSLTPLKAGKANRKQPPDRALVPKTTVVTILSPPSKKPRKSGLENPT
jgi:hypothetical protein